MTELRTESDAPDDNEDAIYEIQGYEQYCRLIEQLCAELEVPDALQVIERKHLEVDGFDIVFDYMEADPDAMYLQFDFGVATQGRTLSIFRLMLESNYLIYAQDQAQLGLDPDNGTARLIIRVAMMDDIDGLWLVDMLNHYLAHGHYWRDNLLAAPDELFEAICAGDYTWMRV